MRQYSSARLSKVSFGIDRGASLKATAPASAKQTKLGHLLALASLAKATDHMNANASGLGCLLPYEFDRTRGVDAGRRAGATQDRREATCEGSVTCRFDRFILLVSRFAQLGAEIDQAGRHDSLRCVDSNTALRAGRRR